MKDQIEYYEQKLNYEMDAWDLNDLIKKGQNVIAIDARSHESYLKEHIKGALSIPYRLMTVENTSHLDKETLYVSYCDGIGCNASTKGALNLTKLGFNVKELIGGLEWWNKDGYETEGTNPANSSSSTCGCS